MATRSAPKSQSRKSGANRRRPAPGSAEPDSSKHNDQRSRLMSALIETVALEGYAKAKVADVARRAGVSRATFYEQFADKEACLLGAQGELAHRLERELLESIGDGEPGRALQSALTSLVAFAASEHHAFNVLMHEAMLAGERAQQQRDALMSTVDEAVRSAWRQAPPDTPRPDAHPRMLLEGTVRLLVLRTAGDALVPRNLPADVLAWADAYTVSDNRARWSGEPLIPPPGRRTRRRHAAKMPERALPRGRHRLDASVVSSVQRERIARATAGAIDAQGYCDVTVADIVATAGLSRDAFYAEFRDRDAAFQAAVQLTFEQLLASLAGAYFGSTGNWSEQIWACGEAFAGFLESDAVLARFLAVGSYAPPEHIARIRDFVMAFTQFVAAGNDALPRPQRASRVATEAIVCSVLEAVNLQIRHDRVGELRGMIPAITYLVYVPFIGTAGADQFLEERGAAAPRRKASTTGPR